MIYTPSYTYLITIAIVLIGLNRYKYYNRHTSNSHFNYFLHYVLLAQTLHDFRKSRSVYDRPDISPHLRLPERNYDELKISPNFE